MRRVIEPLERMGARIEATDGHRAADHPRRAPARHCAPARRRRARRSRARSCSPASTPRARPASSSRPRRATTPSARWRPSAARASVDGLTVSVDRRPAAAAASTLSVPGRLLVGGLLAGRRRGAARLASRDRGRRPESDADGAPRRAAAVRRARRRRGRPATDGRRAARHASSVEGDRTGALDDRAGGSARADRRAAGDRRARGARRRGDGARRRASCASRKAIASPRWSPASARSASTPTSAPTASSIARPAGGARPSGGVADARGDHRMAMAFAIAALARRAARRRIDGADVGRHLVSRLLRDAGPARRVKADKIYLVGFMAAGKTTRRARAGEAARLAGGGHRRADRAARAPDGRRDLRAARRGRTSARVERAGARWTSCRRRHLVVATGGGTFVDPPEPRGDQRRRRLGLARRAARPR